MSRDEALSNVERAARGLLLSRQVGLLVSKGATFIPHTLDEVLLFSVLRV